jgi:hypothetical protein
MDEAAIRRSCPEFFLLNVSGQALTTSNFFIPRQHSEPVPPLEALSRKESDRANQVFSSPDSGSAVVRSD